MTPEPTFSLQALSDRQEILDCVTRYCRAVDRLDRDLLASVYHPDATDDHGIYCGGRDGFIDWAFAHHREHQISHHHMVLNHSCELAGDTAHTETYWMFSSVNKLKPDTLAFGRYLDRFERRHGRWAIAARVCVTECVGNLEECALPAPYRQAMMGNAESSRARTDVSYLRPLQGRSPAGLRQP